MNLFIVRPSLRTTAVCNMNGGFQLVDLIIAELKDYMTFYKLECSHWWKIYLKKKNPLQGLLSSLSAVISTNAMRGIEF